MRERVVAVAKPMKHDTLRIEREGFEAEVAEALPILIFFRERQDRSETAVSCKPEGSPCCLERPFLEVHVKHYGTVYS